MNDPELISFWKEVFLTYYKAATEVDTKTPGTELLAAARANEALKELKVRMEKTDIFWSNSRVIGHPA